MSANVINSTGFKWQNKGGYEELWLEKDVRFTLVHQATCHRRGPWKLLIEVLQHIHDWGCFDDQDAPLRYYHSEERAKAEAEAIAEILTKEKKRGSNPEGDQQVPR
jgi:hypothetical protein